MKKTTQKKQKPAEKEIFFAIQPIGDYQFEVYGPSDSIEKIQSDVIGNMEDEENTGSVGLIIVKQVKTVRIFHESKFRIEENDLVEINPYGDDEDEE